MTIYCLLAVEEFGTGSDGAWETAPVGRLPRVLLIAGRKGSHD